MHCQLASMELEGYKPVGILGSVMQEASKGFCLQVQGIDPMLLYPLQVITASIITGVRWSTAQLALQKEELGN